LTEKIFYTDPYRYELEAGITDMIEKDYLIGLSLDRTSFFSEGEGQPCDRGTIESEGWSLEVYRVEGKDEIWYWGDLRDRCLESSLFGGILQTSVI